MGRLLLKLSLDDSFTLTKLGHVRMYSLRLTSGPAMDVSRIQGVRRSVRGPYLLTGSLYDFVLRSVNRQTVHRVPGFHIVMRPNIPQGFYREELTDMIAKYLDQNNLQADFIPRFTISLDFNGDRRMSTESFEVRSAKVRIRPELFMMSNLCQEIVLPETPQWVQ